MTTPFDPKKYMMNLKGKPYLPVYARLIWFRQDCPDWSIITTPIEINTEKHYAIFTASIMNTEGKIIATGTKMETAKDFGDFLEKAETSAVGRALAMCGFGTQFSLELLEEGDAPTCEIDDQPTRVNNPPGTQGQQRTVPPRTPPPAQKPVRQTSPEQPMQPTVTASTEQQPDAPTPPRPAVSPELRSARERFYTTAGQQFINLDTNGQMDPAKMKNCFLAVIRHAAPAGYVPAIDSVTDWTQATADLPKYAAKVAEEIIEAMKPGASQPDEDTVLIPELVEDEPAGEPALFDASELPSRLAPVNASFDNSAAGKL